MEVDNIVNKDGFFYLYDILNFLFFIFIFYFLFYYVTICFKSVAVNVYKKI